MMLPRTPVSTMGRLETSVANTRYDRPMLPMICPGLELLQIGGGSDAPDGAVARTEVDEVGGGLRPELSRRVEPAGGGGDSGDERADLPALAGNFSPAALALYDERTFPR